MFIPHVKYLLKTSYNIYCGHHANFSMLKSILDVHNSIASAFLRSNTGILFVEIESICICKIPCVSDFLFNKTN